MSEKITITICDDHKLFCKAVEAMLKDYKNITVVKTCYSGAELIKYFTEEKPSAIVLLDIKMPDMNGYEVTKYIKKHFSETRVIGISSYDNDYAISKIIEEGADSFVSKNADPEDLHNVITKVYNNGFYISKWIKLKKNKQLKTALLTDREEELLPLFCSNKPYSQIAAELNVSEKTIDRHRDEIFKKFNVQSRLSLVLFIVDIGIIT